MQHARRPAPRPACPHSVRRRCQLFAVNAVLLLVAAPGMTRAAVTVRHATAADPSPSSPPLVDKAEPSIRVSGVSMEVEKNRTRLVLEANRPIHARVIRPTIAGSPLAIDLGKMAANSVLADLPGIIGHNPALSAARIERTGADVRLVLITTQPVVPQLFTPPPLQGQPDRLVIDLVPTVLLPMPGPEHPGLAQGRPAPVAPIASTGAKAPPTGTPPGKMQEGWFKVYLNGTPEATVLALSDSAGHVLLQPRDLKRWRIRTNGVPRVKHGGQDYCPLSAINGLNYRVNLAQEALYIKLPPGLLRMSQFSGVSGGFSEPTPSPPGAYLNYDVFADRERGSTDASALIETNVFGRYGNLDTTFLTRNSNQRSGMVRLDTTWTQDHPAQMASLRFGDSISGASSWGRSIRFGGVQWATNFATQPEFITLPTLTLHGVAVAPSTVDYYVDNVLRLRRNVPAGPFTIQDLPVITGQGEARMVVTDLLGREQVVTQPFYASSGLLAKDLRAFSYELGFERENYGLDSNDYGKLAAIATERRGLSDRFTGEVHVELARHQQTAGLGADWLVADAGVLTAAVAGSRDTKGSGELLELGFQHRSARLSYGFRTQFTTPDFTQLGYQWPERPPRQASSAYLSFGSRNVGSFGLNYTREDFRDDQADVDFVGVSYSRSLGRLGFLSVSGLHFFGADPSSLLMLSLTVPLTPRDSLSINAQSQAGDRGGSIQFQHNLPAGSGVGYRLQAGLSPSDPDLAEVTLQNDVGTYTFGAANNHGRQAYQASVRGGVALMAGKLFPSRAIDGSFAVVQVPGFANVRVYHDNQEVATTDSDGYALVPRLRPYQDNPIRIEQADLPLDAEIKGLQLDAVPYYHSAVLLKFPVTRSHGAILTIKLPGGGFLPEGAGVIIDGNPTVFPVGMRGEVYLTGLQPINHLRVMWHGQTCKLTVRLPKNPGPLPHLGPVTCPEIKP